MIRQQVHNFLYKQLLYIETVIPSKENLLLTDCLNKQLTMFDIK